MTGHRVQPPLTIEPRASLRLAGFVVVVHLSAAICVCLLPWPWQLGLLPLIASLAYQLAVHVLRVAPWSIRRAHWHSDGSWHIEFADGAQAEARLLGSTFIGLRLVVLNLAIGRWRRLSLPLPADSLDGADLRRLRRRLRIEGIGNQDQLGPAP